MSKTYRINGKVVNNIKQYGHHEEDFSKNSNNNSFNTITSAPIFHNFELRETFSGARRLFYFNDYGYARISFMITSTGYDGVVNFNIFSKDGKLKGEFVFIDLSLTNMFPSLISSIYDCWGYVEPGDYFEVESLSLETFKIRGFYRLQNTKSDVEGVDNKITTKVSDYVVNENNLKEYNVKEDKWDYYVGTNDNESAMVSALEVDTSKEISLTPGKPSKIYTFKKDGYAEISLRTGIAYIGGASLTVTLKDENGKNVKTWEQLQTDDHLVQPEYGFYLFDVAHEVKKGWSVHYTTIALGVVVSSLIANTPTYRIIDSEVKDKPIKTLMYNNNVINDVSIEEYDNVNKKWTPLKNEKNDKQLHTVPYLLGGTYYYAVSHYERVTVPIDGYLSAWCDNNSLFEVAGNVKITVYRDGYSIDGGNIIGNYLKVSAIPRTTTIGTALGVEVKKGDVVSFSSEGLSGGRVIYNLKIDPIYSIVDGDGNYIKK